jgi:hypothetical protein
VKITVEMCDEFLVAFSQILDRVKSVALWSAKKRTIKGYGSAATQILDRAPFYLGVGISINSGEINLVLYDHAFSNNTTKKTKTKTQKHPRQTNYYLSYQIR